MSLLHALIPASVQVDVLFAAAEVEDDACVAGVVQVAAAHVQTFVPEVGFCRVPAQLVGGEIELVGADEAPGKAVFRIAAAVDLEGIGGDDFVFHVAAADKGCKRLERGKRADDLCLICAVSNSSTFEISLSH